MDNTRLESIRDGILETQRRIEAACKRSGRNPSDVTLIAVSKTMPVEDLRAAMECKIIEFGENKPQELRDKQAEITEPLHWHMIGALQTNKLKYVVGKTVRIHSVDSVHLAQAIEEESAKKQVISDILLEVNVAAEESKHGFCPQELIEAVTTVSAFPHVKIRGLMTVAPYTDNPEENRKYFRKMKELMVDINSKNIDNVVMSELSMGMTGDFEVAVEEGSTYVRVGTGIFGHRDYSNKK